MYSAHEQRKLRRVVHPSDRLSVCLSHACTVSERIIVIGRIKVLDKNSSCVCHTKLSTKYACGRRDFFLLFSTIYITQCRVTAEPLVLFIGCRSYLDCFISSLKLLEPTRNAVNEQSCSIGI